MKWTTTICLAALLVFSCITPLPLHAQEQHVKGMWVWDFYTSAFTEEQREQLIQFSLQHNINLLFVGTRLTLKEHPSAYADLIQKARQNGIRVFALAGRASWAWEENHHEPLAHLQQVLDYNSVYPSTPFDGLQFDIEPYILSDYWDNTDRVNSQLLQLLEASARLINETEDPLELNAAIPFWYASGQRPMMAEVNGASKPLSHHILDIVDSVSIMAYRDHANAQIEVSKADIEFAESIGKKAYIGAETKPPNDEGIPDWITYYNKKTSYMNEQFEIIHEYYRNNSGFGGIAVHTYDSYKEMQQKEEELYPNLDQKFNVLKTAGIMTGYPDGSAGFGKTATRAEVAVIAARLGGYSDTTLYTPSSASFDDVAPREWCYGWIESAYQMGVMEGKGGRRFDPNANITLEEALIVTAKTIGLSKERNAIIQGASAWAQGWIQAMMNEGLIENRNLYTDDITRDELVELVYEAYLLRMKNQ